MGRRRRRALIALLGSGLFLLLLVLWLGRPSMTARAQRERHASELARRAATWGQRKAPNDPGAQPLATGEPAATIDNFADRRAVALCRRLVRCGASQTSHLDLCLSHDVGSRDEEERRLAQLVAAGEVDFDPGSEAVYLAELDTTCDVPKTKSITGRKQEGETCHSRWSCAKGLRCDGEWWWSNRYDRSIYRRGGGRCVPDDLPPRVKAGEACRGLGCESGFYCDGFPGVCRPVAAEGASCVEGGANNSCGEDLTCLGGTCQKEPGLDQPCGKLPRGVMCQGGYCADDGFCRVRRDLGEPCHIRGPDEPRPIGATFECRRPLRCLPSGADVSAGTCQVGGDVAAPCSVDSDCLTDLHCGPWGVCQDGPWPIWLPNRIRNAAARIELGVLKSL